MYETLLVKNRITEASRVWNVDESGVDDIPKVGKTVGIKGEIAVQTVSGDRGVCSTFLKYTNVQSGTSTNGYP